MAKFYSAAAFTLVFGILFTCLEKTDGQTGVCYGMVADNLPPPQDVVALYNQHNIQRMRLYVANQDVLHALNGSNSNIELMLDLDLENIQNMASSQENANAWVNTNVKSYSAIKYRYINVGNEVDRYPQFFQFLLPALMNIKNAVSAAGLGDKIKVSTVISASALGQSYPPSAGSFKPEFQPIINPVVQFLASTNAPLIVNSYPYFAYASNQKDIPLDYALCRSRKVVVQDGPLSYRCLFDAMLDSFSFAADKAGGPNMEVVVSESGWPTAGNGNITTVRNAEAYNNRLIQHVKRGTPKRPGRPIETYLFAMFDEYQKGPQEVERHWGLFFPNKQPKYQVTFS